MGDSFTEHVRRKLQEYCASDVCFNEPHFSQQLALRDGDEQEVIDTLLNPERLVYAYPEGDDKQVLHFKMSATRTLRLPVIFDKGGQRNIFVLTYILRHRKWQSMVRRGR
ncbi:hypothetical protein JXA12_01710 [Candidatus Woesearchaeota archaeon]|nr:hypothetical protein [Candidatus Woesearchaeota archaeon]